MMTIRGCCSNCQLVRQYGHSFIYPLVVMIAAGIINIFIPSSGDLDVQVPDDHGCRPTGVAFNGGHGFTAERSSHTISLSGLCRYWGYQDGNAQHHGYCIVSTTVLSLPSRCAISICHVKLPSPGGRIPVQERTGTLTEYSGSLLPKAGAKGAVFLGEARADRASAAAALYFDADALV